MNRSCLIACSMATVVSGALAQPVYVLEEVPTLGGVDSYATAISDTGWVVGGAKRTDGTGRAIRFRDGLIEELGSLPGLRYSAATGVNNSDQVVGTCSATADVFGLSSVAVLFSEGRAVRLAGPSSNASGRAAGINDAGTIVGSSLLRAAVWVPQPGGDTHDLRQVAVQSSCDSHVTCINQAGMIAGYAADAACSTNFAFVGTAAQVVAQPDLGGGNAAAMAINDLGDVVGYSEDSQGRNRATLWRDGHAFNLGTLGGASFATGMNNDGIVVGYYLDLLNRQRAFLWFNGQMMDLEALILPAGFRPLIATGINNNGVIVGQGRNASGRLRGFVLHPTDRPRCNSDFNADGGVDGADVTAFFAAWEAGSTSADVNYDGGTDGADVTRFFELWETGGC